MGGSQQSATRVQGAVHEECAGCEFTAGFHTRTSCTSTASCTRAHCTHLLARGCLGGIAAPGPHFARGLLAPGPTHLPCPNPPQTLYPPNKHVHNWGGPRLYLEPRGGEDARGPCKGARGLVQGPAGLVQGPREAAEDPGGLCKARRSRARPRGTRARLDGAAHHHGGLVQEPREATAGRARPRRPRAKPRTAPGGNGARPCERRGHL